VVLPGLDQVTSWFMNPGTQTEKKTAETRALVDPPSIPEKTPGPQAFMTVREDGVNGCEFFMLNQ
jgi:hypothetical protein